MLERGEWLATEGPGSLSGALSGGGTPEPPTGGHCSDTGGFGLQSHRCHGCGVLTDQGLRCAAQDCKRGRAGLVWALSSLPEVRAESPREEAARDLRRRSAAMVDLAQRGAGCEWPLLGADRLGGVRSRDRSAEDTRTVGLAPFFMLGRVLAGSPRDFLRGPLRFAGFRLFFFVLPSPLSSKQKVFTIERSGGGLGWVGLRATGGWLRGGAPRRRAAAGRRARGRRAPAGATSPDGPQVLFAIAVGRCRCSLCCLVPFVVAVLVIVVAVCCGCLLLLVYYSNNRASQGRCYCCCS